MKKLLQSLFFFLMVTQICFGQPDSPSASQGGWYQQNSGTDKKLYAVQFTDANNGFAVGDSGTILQTTNAGANWVTQVSGLDIILKSVCFTDINIGTVVGDDGTILRTTNGGVNWTAQASGTNKNLNSVYYINEITGWTVGGSLVNIPAENVILKTTDGGINWSPQSSSTNYPLTDVHFNDVNNGFIVGGYWGYSAVILRTTDGGNTWIEITGPGISGYHFGVSFADELTGIVVGAFHGLDYIDSHRLVYTGDLQQVESQYFRKDNFPKPLWGPGHILRTTNGGITWQTVLDTVSVDLNCVTFIDDNNGWVVGGEFWFSGGGGCVLSTNDGGLTWTEQISGISNALSSVFFNDALTGWAVGANGTILHTTNGGVSFVEEEQFDEIPTEFSLSQNYPNPFNPSTTFNYSIPTQSKVVIKVFDILGNEVATLMDEEKSVGTYELTWYAEQLPCGVYFYHLKTNSFVQTRKMLLMK